MENPPIFNGKTHYKWPFPYSHVQVPEGYRPRAPDEGQLPHWFHHWSLSGRSGRSFFGVPLAGLTMPRLLLAVTVAVSLAAAYATWQLNHPRKVKVANFINKNVMLYYIVNYDWWNSPLGDHKGSDPLRQTTYAPSTCTACTGTYPIVWKKKGRRSEAAMTTLYTLRINIFGTIFRTNERSTKTQTDKTKKSSSGSRTDLLNAVARQAHGHLSAHGRHKEFWYIHGLYI